MKCSCSGRKCDGYADPFRSRTILFLPSRPPESSRNACNLEPIPGPASDLRISACATTGLPPDARDRRYLDHFRHNSVQDFSSILDTDLWSNYILRVSAFTPAVEHAILALSAQHESFLKYGHGRVQSVLINNDPINSYSRDQYSKAIRSLYSRLDKSPDDKTTTEEALVTCLLFVIYETLQGNYNAALIHLEGGLSMFSTFRLGTTGLPISESFDKATPTSSLAKLFTRLDIHASSYVGVRNIGAFSAPSDGYSPQLSLPAILGQIKRPFLSIGDARDTLNKHIAYIFSYLRSPAPSLLNFPDLISEKVMELRYNPRLHAANADSSVFADVIREQEFHLASLNRWMLNFQDFLEQSASLASQHGATTENANRGGEAQECAAIWLSYLVTFITISNCFEPDESSYDEYLPQFQKIVEHANSFLRSKLGDSKCGHNRRRFSFEMSVIYPLYITALKCRDHTVRRHAISLLHISGQEGVWNGKMLATITEHVADHEEEQGFVDIFTEKPIDSRLGFESEEIMANSSKWSETDVLLIPESARIHGVVVDLFDPGSGNVWIDSSTRKFTYKQGSEYKAEWFERCEWEFHQKLLEW